MLPEDEVRLRHMRDTALEAIGFARGRGRDDLEIDRQLLYAILMAIGIIGEAASKVSPRTREQHPEVPWPAIVAMRNRLVHAYFDVNRDIVWMTVADELPALASALDQILARTEA